MAEPRRGAVIGAGVTGLVAAYRLAQAGWRVDVYERWPGLGGQAATLDVGGGHLLERYYHVLFKTDREIADLYAELGMPDAIEWRDSRVAIHSDGRTYPFTTPADLLRYEPLSPLSRVRLGAAVLWLQLRHRRHEPLEDRTVQEWVERAMGREAWAKVWGPLMRAKFGARGDEISMAWLWSKLTLRRRLRGTEARKELLGYPRESWEPLHQALRREIEAGGGRVMIDRAAHRLARAADGRGIEVTPAAPESFRRGHDPRAFTPGGEPERYDGVVATVPSDVFERLLDPALAAEVGEPYMARVRSAEYQTTLCLLLELDRSLVPFYWTNIADEELPFIGIVEHTDLVEPERYGGRRFTYVANYMAPDDPLLDLDADELLERYEPGLRRLNPGFSRDWVRARWRFSEPAAQPVVTVGYRDRIPPLATGVPGLVLANTTQIYPEDRGTNYSVRLAGDAVDALTASAGA